MHVFLIRRLLAAVPVIVVVTVFVFALLHLAPGDPAAIIAGDLATAEDVAKIRAKLGLDQPLLIQFFTWVGQLLRGDLGNSIFSAHPVSELIGQRLEPTLTLTVMTLVISVLLAVPLGVIAAWRVGSWIDRGVMGFAVFGFSVPGFVIGYVLIWLFAIELDWLPVQGYTPLAKGFWPWLVQHHPAERHARARLHGADRAHHARGDAGDAEPGLHPHRARQGPRHRETC